MILSRFRSIVISQCHPSYLNKSHFTLRFIYSSRHAQSNLTIPTADHLLDKHQFSPETASKVSSVLPHLKDPEKADFILSFFKESGFSKTQLERVVERMPKILCSELESSIKPKIKILLDFGSSPTDVAEFISVYPRILNPSPDVSQLRRSILMLREVIGCDLNATHFHSYRYYLHSNSEKTVLSNIELLQTCGISVSQLKSTLGGMYLSNVNPETLKQAVKRVDDMGVSRESKLFFQALRTAVGMKAENWEHKVDLFRNLGFSEDEIVSMFRTAPTVFMSSETKIKEMTEVLLGSGVYDLSSIVSQPRILIFSIERTIKPRLQVLKILKRKNLLITKASANFYRITEKKFIDRYVLPFADRASELLGMVNNTKNQLKVIE